jgi:hypothetical protein
MTLEQVEALLILADQMPPQVPTNKGLRWVVFTRPGRVTFEDTPQGRREAMQLAYQFAIGPCEITP